MPRATRAYLLHLELRDIQPPIWRQIIIASQTSLAQLHRVIQLLMGWYDCRLYAFRFRGVEFAPPHPDEVPRDALPMCVGGQRHGPLEDSGGPLGYQDLLAVLAEPDHDEYQSMSEWAPAEFDTEDFSVEEANEQLHDEFPP